MGYDEADRMARVEALYHLRMQAAMDRKSARQAEAMARSDARRSKATLPADLDYDARQVVAEYDRIESDFRAERSWILEQGRRESGDSTNADE